MRVLAIDFETANAAPESACSIGYCLMDSGEILENDEILIKPHPRYGFFSYHNIEIHHITPKMVQNCESWPYVFCDITRLFDDSVVLAHNAGFDITVLRSLNRLYDIDMPDFLYLDTVGISRCLFPQLPNHKLNTVCDYLGLEFEHHRAKDDSMGCIAIIERAMEIYEEYDIEKLMKNMFLHARHYLTD